MTAARRLPLLAVALPVLGAAAPWESGVNVDLGVIHTDNLFLAEDGMEESDTVYTVAPEFYLQTESERTTANLRYRPEGYFYSDFNEFDDVYHVVDATLRQALVQDRFFISFSGSNFQSIRLPEASVPTTNLPVTGNRVDSRALEVRPSWEQKIGAAQLYMDGGYRDLEYDDEQYQSSNETFGTFRLNNFERQQGLAWGMNYDYRRLEYEESPPFEFQRASLNLGVWATGSLRIFGVGGVETGFDDILDPKMDEDFWEAGFQYVPNQRLNLEVAAGEHSYGESLRASVSYTLRRGSLSLSYNETPSGRAETVFNRRPLVDTDQLDGLLDRPGDADRFLRKHGEARLSIELSKSDLTLRVFTEDRDQRSTAEGMPLDDESLWGIAARWEWRFGSKTTLHLDADFVRREDMDRDDKIRRFLVGFAYQLSTRTSIRLEGMRAEQEGDIQGPGDYTENQARLLFRLELP